MWPPCLDVKTCAEANEESQAGPEAVRKWLEDHSVIEAVLRDNRSRKDAILFEVLGEEVWLTNLVIDLSEYMGAPIGSTTLLAIPTQVAENRGWSK
jgi:hypothetical protein